MNMINSIGANSASFSPRAMMDKRIDTAVQSGSISQTDETALESALDSIDSAMGVGSTSGSASTQTSKLDPSQMGDRIDDLIDQQVQNGTLTQDQANTLQSLFAQNGPPPGGPDGASGDGSDDASVSGVSASRHRHHGGPPPAQAASTTSLSSDSADSAVAGATDESKQLDALMAFIDNMRQKLGASGTYGSSGATSTATSTSSASGLVVDSYA